MKSINNLSKNWISGLVILLGILAFSCTSISAQVIIAENTQYNIFGDRTPGQSFTTPNNGTSYTLNSFTWLDFSNSVGAGNLFILNQAYTGTPLGLSSSTPGYLAESNLYSNGLYSFTGANQIVLQANTQYFAYTQAGDNAFEVTWQGPGTYPGGSGYFQNPTNYQQLNSDFTFVVNGTAVPEPSAWALFAVGVLGLFVYGCRSRREHHI